MKDVDELRDPTGLEVAGRLERLSGPVVVVAANVVMTEVVGALADAEEEAIEEREDDVPATATPCPPELLAVVGVLLLKSAGA